MLTSGVVMKTINRMTHCLNGNAEPIARMDSPPVAPSLPKGYGEPPAPARKVARETAQPPADRDTKTGRFAPGNSAAAGHVNPTARARADLQKALIAAVSPDDIAAVARRLRDDALGGNVPSAELLLKYVVGRPARAADPDRVELEAWKMIQSWPWLSEFMVTVGRTVHPETAAKFAGCIVTASGEGVIQKLAKAEDEVDEWGNPYVGKQTDALIKRRVTQGK